MSYEDIAIRIADRHMAASNSKKWVKVNLDNKEDARWLEKFKKNRKKQEREESRKKKADDGESGSDAESGYGQWEPPSAGRKKWRRKTPSGKYEYRDKPPKGFGDEKEDIGESGKGKEKDKGERQEGQDRPASMSRLLQKIPKESRQVIIELSQNVKKNQEAVLKGLGANTSRANYEAIRDALEGDSEEFDNEAWREDITKKFEDSLSPDDKKAFGRARESVLDFGGDGFSSSSGAELSSAVSKVFGIKNSKDYRMKGFPNESADEEIVRGMRLKMALDQAILMSTGLVDKEGNVVLYRWSKHFPMMDKDNPEESVGIEAEGSFVDSWTFSPNLKWGGQCMRAKFPLDRVVASCYGSDTLEFSSECEVMIQSRIVRGDALSYEAVQGEPLKLIERTKQNIADMDLVMANLKGEGGDFDKPSQEPEAKPSQEPETKPSQEPETKSKVENIKMDLDWDGGDKKDEAVSKGWKNIVDGYDIQTMSGGDMEGWSVNKVDTDAMSEATFSGLGWGSVQSAIEKNNPDMDGLTLDMKISSLKADYGSGMQMAFLKGGPGNEWSSIMGYRVDDDTVNIEHIVGGGRNADRSLVAAILGHPGKNIKINLDWSEEYANHLNDTYGTKVFNFTNKMKGAEISAEKAKEAAQIIAKGEAPTPSAEKIQEAEKAFSDERNPTSKELAELRKNVPPGTPTSELLILFKTLQSRGFFNNAEMAPEEEVPKAASVSFRSLFASCVREVVVGDMIKRSVKNV
jgi:hypothetical protein